ncbi:NAD(P)-binding protein [Auriculariales sp. MPI-PUGE-AT-0066]|nr:NAD(P)-binding protein [Auriculariales sp. MPI-PUGE-AT-0066]
MFAVIINFVNDFLQGINELFPGRKSSWTAADMPDQSGRVVIVTGGNAGIGLETVKQLLLKNATVYMASRSRQRAEEAIVLLEKETGRRAIFLELDLASLASVKNAVDEFTSKEEHLNVLYNSGGVMATPINKLSADGFDLQFGTNTLGHFYLTQLLMPILLKTSAINPNDKPRDVSTDQLLDIARRTRRRKLSPLQLYAQSKTANIILSRELARRYGDKIIAISLHPGVLRTELISHICPMFHPTWMGALNQLYAGTSPEAMNLNGKYLIPWVRLGKLPATLEDPTVGEKLWGSLEELVKNVA